MSAMWKMVGGSVAGTSHVEAGTRCQDYGHAIVVDQPDGLCLVAACADGAGSAPRSATGARLACLAFLQAAGQALRSGASPDTLGEEDVRAWAGAARRALSLEACLQGAPLRDYACTLLAAVVGPRRSVFAQIGDGAIVFRIGEAYEPAAWPQAGEYANTTWFLTGDDFDSRLAVVPIRGEVREVALFTDGLQGLALRFEERCAHGPFFAPMFQQLRGAGDAEALEEPLRRYLDSGAVNERTDDDKTLILAARGGME